MTKNDEKLVKEYLNSVNRELTFVEKKIGSLNHAVEKKVTESVHRLRSDFAKESRKSDKDSIEKLKQKIKGIQDA